MQLKSSGDNSAVYARQGPRLNTSFVFTLSAILRSVRIGSERSNEEDGANVFLELFTVSKVIHAKMLF